MTSISSLADYSIAGHSVLYRNPRPHVRSFQAYFPSVVVIGDRHLGASVVLGEAFEAPNLHVGYFESRDGGVHWERKSMVTEPAADLRSSSMGRLTLLSDGSLVVMVTRHERQPFDEGITDGKTVGMMPMRIEMYRSRDQGRSWAGPDIVDPPLHETSFEMCSGFTVLDDGTLLWPTSTWPVSGQAVTPDKFRTGAFLSKDNGKTWPRWVEAFPNDNYIYWESKILVLPDRRLLGVAWVHDLVAGRDLPNHFVIGNPDGSSWSTPQSMEILGQTLSSLVLPDGQILSVYRRVDEPGLWATVSQIEGERWVNSGNLLLWQGDGGASNDPSKIRQHFATLKFGAPSIVRLNDGQILVAFWCVIDGVSQISTITLSKN